jgi:hypothetical protein
MCPAIEITEHTYSLLQSVAIPLVDTPDTIIQRLVRVYENRERKSSCVDGVDFSARVPSGLSGVGKQENSLLTFTEKNIPDVTHTTFTSGNAGGRDASDWNHLMLLAHAIAYECLGRDINALNQASTANIKEGEEFAHGFKNIKGYPFSVQGVEANKACSIVLQLAKKFRFSVEANFRWQAKERAAYPGRLGKIYFDGQT